MREEARSAVIRYGFAALSAIAALAISLPLRDELGHGYALIFLTVVIVAGWYGGFGPGLFCAMLGAAILGFTFYPPIKPSAIEVENSTLLILFLVLSVLVSLLNGMRLRDLSQRKAIEAALRQSENLYRASFELAAAGQAQLDLKTGRFQQVNRKLCEITGYSEAELLRMSPDDLTHPDDLEIDADLFQQFIRGEAKEYSTRKRCIRKDGSIRWVEVSAAMLRDAAGQPLRSVGVIQDITEKVKAEEEVRAALGRVDSVLSSITEAYFVLDREFRFVEVNPAARRLIFRDMKAEELIGNSIWELFPAGIDSIFYHEYHRAMREQVEVHFEGRSKIVDRWFEAHAYPRGGWLEVYVRDISDRKRAEAERAELLEREQEARRLAEATNRAKDEFLATLSHELRTPLNAIIGWSDLLLHRQVAPPMTEHAVEVINRNARTQARLIEDLLDVSRIITGNLVIDLRPVDLLASIGSALDALRPAAEGNSIRFAVDFHAPNITVLGDSTRLQQIVWNLLANAIKFTPSGGSVRVEARKIDGSVEMTIRDTGAGIDPAFLPYIFDRFTQADSSRTRAHSGLGLGLAIARHLVELHGGTIHADSPGLNQGTSITVRLPLAESFDHAGQAPGAAAGDEDAARPLAGVRILVVEDHEDTRDMIAAMLAGAGANVHTEATARAGLESLRGWRPDVLISDIGLPGEDGYDLIRKVRALRESEGGATPAMALTGYASPEESERLRRAGYQHHLAKPIELNDLLTSALQLAQSNGKKVMHPEP